MLVVFECRYQQADRHVRWALEMKRDEGGGGRRTESRKAFSLKMPKDKKRETKTHTPKQKLKTYNILTSNKKC